MSYVTPALNLKILLKNRSGLRELWIVVAGRCLYLVLRDIEIGLVLHEL